MTKRTPAFDNFNFSTRFETRQKENHVYITYKAIGIE